MTAPDPLVDETYHLQLELNGLGRMLSESTDAPAAAQIVERMTKLQAQLVRSEAQLAARRLRPAARPALLTGQAASKSTLRGPQTTKLEATVVRQMHHLPTAIYHVLDPNEHPLVECSVRNLGAQTRRVRVISYVEDYTARAVSTVEIRAKEEARILQQPTLFPQRVRDVHELSRATLNLQVEDLDANLEHHETRPIWLLARNVAPLGVLDPGTGAWIDLSRYLGVFVTPNEPSVLAFLRRAAERHPDRRLAGYQPGCDAAGQVQAVFEALQTDAEITYVNSLIANHPDDSASSQRVRLPRESLQERQANCIDGVLLYASLLEAASLHPALVLVPGHALLAWRSAATSGSWEFLETTMTSSHSFAEARQAGALQAARWEQESVLNNHDPYYYRLWSLAELRVVHRITPME